MNVADKQLMGRCHWYLAPRWPVPVFPGAHLPGHLWPSRCPKDTCSGLP